MKTLSKIYFLISLAILSGLAMSCNKDEVTPTKGEVIVTLKTRDNTVIADAEVKLASSLQDLSEELFLSETTTDAKGMIKFGVVTAGNYYLSINCKIGDDIYDIIKAIQVKPGEKADVTILPEDFTGKVYLSFVSSYNSVAKVKTGGIKVALVPVTNKTKDEYVPADLIKLATKKLVTDANGEIIFEKTPVSSYRVLLYTDEEHVIFSSNVIWGSEFKVEKRENYLKVRVDPTTAFFAEKKWTVQSTKDSNGKDVNLNYESLIFHFDEKFDLTLKDGTKKPGTFYVYNNGTNASMTFKDSNTYLNPYFDVTKNSLKVTYYDTSLSKNITIDLKK